MHISLDGFAATSNRELSWVKVDDELFTHVEKRISEGNTALYGRKTYDMMEDYWPTAGKKPNATRHEMEHSKWYDNVHKIVLSNTLKTESRPNTTIISDNLKETISKIKQQPGPEILLFGSPTATHSLLQHDLIDGFWLFVNPIILAKGIPLFENISDKINLKLLNTRTFTSGVIELNYIRG